MKTRNIIAILLSSIIILASACDDGSNIGRAYKIFESGGDYVEAATLISADTIDYSELSMKELAKLGLTITYISACTIDESDKIDMDRFEEISREYEKVKSSLTPEQAEKLKEERNKLVK